MHHAVSDEWSTGLLRQELTELYDGFSGGRPPDLAELPIQYADYAVWQRQFLSGARLQRDLAYWHRRLDGAPPLRIIADRPRPKVIDPAGATVSFAVPEPVARALRELARQRDTHAVHGAAGRIPGVARSIHRPGRHRGRHPGGRTTQAETQHLIGFFVNTVVLRTDLSGNPAFTTLLERVRTVTVEAYDHQDTPFEKLVDELNPDRDLSRTPLFDVMFGYEDTTPAAPERFGRLACQPFAVPGPGARYDLMVNVADQPAGIEGRISYRTTLFDQPTIERLASHYTTLLAGVATSAATRLSDLPLDRTSRPPERPAPPHPGAALQPGVPLGVLEAIVAQATRHPDAVALTDDHTVLTYHDLIGQVDRLAQRLRWHGVGPDTIVGIHLDRSVGLVVAALAVWRAGGAYVPLELGQPASRLAQLIDGAAAAIVLTAAGTGDALPKQVAQLDVDGSEADEAYSTGWQPPASPPHPDQLAYIMHTSGSAGEPKAVAVNHTGLSNVLTAAGALIGLTEHDVVLAITTLAFDIAAAELFMPLMCGARVHVAATGVAGDPHELLRQAGRIAATVVQATPATWRLMLDVGWPSPTPRVLCTGEALSSQLAQALLRRSPHVWNLYGPTETTIWSTVDQIRPDRDVAIGAAIARTVCHVVDRWGQPAPTGVPGELLIGGPGVARGYAGRCDLTAERFIADPFGATGTRLYRTGDLVRRLADGRLAYLGRIDDQVKIRGFRVEPAEVEHALETHHGVAHAVAAARPDPTGDSQRLLAWVVPTHPDRPPDPLSLRRFVAARLPGHLVPAVIGLIDTVPVTPSGKINRAALPDVDAPARPSGAGSSEPPIGATQRDLADIWREVLGIDRIDRTANFFDLGGHSLLAAQVVGRVAARLGIRPSLRSLFEHPVLADFAAEVDRVAATDTPRTEVVIPTRDRHTPPPLSYAQQRLWFVDQLHPGAEHNVVVAWRLTGALDRAALRRSLDRIVARHEILHTTYPSTDGVPAVVTAAPHAADWTETTASQDDVDGTIAAEASRPIDLRRGPVLRARLLRLGEAEHILVIVAHHIAVDEWSIGVLAGELVNFYPHEVHGHPATPAALPDLPVQYADYAAWQRQTLTAQHLQAGVEHWRTRLAGLARLDLPTDRPYPAQRSAEADWVELAVAPSSTAQLAAAARQHQATMFMTIVAALSVVLARYSGHTDIAIGTPVSGRSRPELEPMIGLFLNTIVLRVDLSGDPTFGQLIDRVRHVTLDAYAHREVPFEHLVDALGAPRDRARQPLFNVMLNYVSDTDPPVARPTPPNLAGLAVCAVDTAPVTGRFDLRLTVRHDGTQLHAGLQFRRDIFDRATATDFAAHLHAVLTDAAAHPARPVDRLARAVTRPVQVPTSRPPGATLPDILATTAQRTPGGVAINDGNRRLTYAQLDQATSRLSQHLRARGFGPEQVVAMLLPHTVDLIVAVLGIWRAGGAYLMLNPAEPLRRLADQLNTCQAALVLSTDEFLDALPATRVPILTIDEAHDLPATTTPDRHHPAGIAYVVFTSGSTGQPKPVAVTHENLANYTSAIAERVRPDSGSTWTLTQPLSVDLGLTNLVLALATGGALRIADPATFVPALIADPPDYLKTTPTHLDVLLTHPDGARGLPRRALLLGGEPTPPALLAALDRTGWRGELYNHYGPAECTVGAATGHRDALFTLGQPLSGVVAHVLDRHGNPVATHIPGELHLGGSGVARGYLGQPELTAAQFVADPFGPPGARMYRTGDLVRRRSDNRLEYLGRIDEQLNLGANRVEPAEIEAAIRTHPDVTAAAVAARTDGAGRPRLVAWVKPAVPVGIRAYLTDRLPGALIPARFVAAADLPTAASGKLDRSRLVEPNEPDTRTERFVAPDGPTETRLAALWSDILGMAPIGRDDVFFDLGGHSLSATQVIARLPRLFGVELPLTDLFDHPTLRSLAARIDQQPPATDSPIAAADRGRPLPLSFGQQRLWFLHRLEPSSVEYTIPVVIRLDGPLDQSALAAALTAVVHRHETLRTTFTVMDGQPVQVIHPPAPVPLPILDVPDAATADRMIAEDIACPFDLATGPLLRARLLRIDTVTHLLCVLLHHVVSDLVSAQILRRDLAACYRASRTGTEPDLPALPVQYADYAAWQRTQLTGRRIDDHLTYWRRQLADLPALQLPSDRPRTTSRSADAGILAVTVEAAIADGLRQLAARSNATVFMTVVAAIDVLLSRWCGQRDITVATPVAGRTRTDTDDLIGFFVNTLVLRTDLSGTPSFSDVLARVRRTTLAALAHQDVPFEYLVDDLAVERDLSRHPLFDVLVAFQHGAEPPLALPGLAACDLGAPLPVTVVDLVFNVADIGGELRVAVEYRTDLFDRERIEGLATALRSLLAAVARDPDRPVEAIELPLDTTPTAAAPAPPSHARPDARTDRRAAEAPVTRAEHALADIWQHLLAVPQVHRHDNFFHLGGHSLLATQLIDTMNVAFATSLPLRLVFERPVLADLATAVEQAVLDDVEAMSEHHVAALLHTREAHS